LLGQECDFGFRFVLVAGHVVVADCSGLLGMCT
jgi:hypothetical protein